MVQHAQCADCSLPPDGFVERWTSARKEAVLLALHAGQFTVSDALRRWNISLEELDLWMVAYRRRGRNGLKARETPKQGRLL